MIHLVEKRIRKSSRSRGERFRGHHRFEHWYVDNQVYFITARCRDRYRAFGSEQAKEIFWDRFQHYTEHAGFFPWVTSLLDNHYHTVRYLREGIQLKTMMQRLHGSVAKLVNDLLPQRRAEFWRDTKGREYIDGCVRDARQCQLAYRYTLTQSVRHSICTDYRDYPHTRINVAPDRGLIRAVALGAFLQNLPYTRYECL